MFDDHHRRLKRHTQLQDLTEVVIVAPGWEYMLLQLQRQAARDLAAMPKGTRYLLLCQKCHHHWKRRQKHHHYYPSYITNQ
jgi:hypothetical protein